MSYKEKMQYFNHNRENCRTIGSVVRGVGQPGQGGFAVDFTVSSFLFSYFLSTL